MPPAAVPISPVGPVATATMVFRENGQVRVAAIVKATFAFVHHGPMRLATPEGIFTKEAHRMNNPTRSIVATSDLVPRLPGADVLLLGHAHAPGGSAARVTVRLAVGRGEATLLDKRVHVIGDRRGSEIAPFKSMPLVYEKAFGGPGYRDNPIGTGALAGDAPPNVVDPIAPDRVAGFGPISRSWPARTVLAPAAERAGLDKPIAEIPPGFDFRFFHAAPADQRIGQLVGDEWVVLEGVHPELPHVHLLLPGAMAMVRVVGTESDGRIFSLRADTLRIDAEAERCTLVWRNSFPVREGDLGAVRLLAGVALPDAPIAWPALADSPAETYEAWVPASGAPAEKALRAAAAGNGGTMVLEDAAPKLAATFGGTIEIADEDLEPASEAVPDFGGTAVLASTAIPPTQPLPSYLQSPAPAPAPVPPKAPARTREAKEATLDLSDNFEAIGRAILPFAGKPAEEPSSSAARPSAPIPGSPWDTSRGPATPQSIPSTEAVPALAATPGLPATLALETLALESPPPEPPAVETPPLDTPPPPATPPVAAAPAREPPADPWGQALREAPEPPRPAPAAPRPAEPGPSLKNALYKRFKK